ncbi:type VII secretion target [Plantactinospora solaniradicis]|uniref:Type VII secretion target n=1 Tax=Plantactinospora solaniradicis TaxID=1723736 RepID=A0ABW1KAI7_9ACTN
MSFKADHTGIREFGTAVGDLTDDADAAARYVQQHLGIGYAEGRMFVTVVEGVSNAREQLQQLYSRLNTLTSASAQEVNKAAKYYQTTDAAAAERLDRTY